MDELLNGASASELMALQNNFWIFFVIDDRKMDAWYILTTLCNILWLCIIEESTKLEDV